MFDFKCFALIICKRVHTLLKLKIFRYLKHFLRNTLLLRVKFTKSYTEMRGVSTYYHHIFLTFLLRSWSKWTTLQLSAKMFYSCRSISLISSAHYTVRKTEQKILLWVWVHDYLYLKAKHQRVFFKNFSKHLLMRIGSFDKENIQKLFSIWRQQN